MSRPIVLKGVIHGKTITLDEETFLPEGHRVTLHLVLEPGEGLRFSFGCLADMTEEDEKELEAMMSELEGLPVQRPGPEAS